MYFYLSFFCRTSQQSSSKYTLFELMYKRKARLPIEIVTSPEEIDDPADVDTAEDVERHMHGENAEMGR